MNRKLARLESRIYVPVPVLDEEFSSNDFHHTIYEMDAFRNQTAEE